MGILFKAHQGDEDQHTLYLTWTEFKTWKVSKYIDEPGVDVENDPLL